MLKFISQLSPYLGMPENISIHGSYIDALIVLVHVLMAIIFVGWFVYFVYVIIRFSRKRKGEIPRARGKLAKKIEVIIVLSEILLLLFISIPVWTKFVVTQPKGEKVVKVRVLAQQFAWNIHYPGEDGIFGETYPELVDPQVNPIGLDREEDPHAQDDIVTVNEFYFPVDRPVVIELSSFDVIHSFFIPQLRVKQDAVPGMRIPTWFHAKKEGKYEIACAQLCGVGHYRMRGHAYSVSQEEYDEWLVAELEEQSEGGGDDSDWF